jgi:hypothetical protein
MLGRKRRADKAVPGEIVMSLDWTPVRGSVVGGIVSVLRSPLDSTVFIDTEEGREVMGYFIEFMISSFGADGSCES